VTVPTIRLAVVVVCAAVAWSKAAVGQQRSSSDAAAQVIALTNKERARHRLPPLEPSARLIRAAQIHAEQMVRAGRLDHELGGAKYPRTEDRLKAVKYVWRAWAENVAFGQEDPEQVLRSWLKSKHHRENVLSTRVTEIGVGRGSDRQGRAYWVQLFGRPAS
jgi:uncharacterized protein YkwD